MPTCVLSLRGDAPCTHNTSSHLLKTPILHVLCLLEGKQSLTFQGRKGKATRDAGHSKHGLLSWQQRRAVGIITPWSEAGGRVEGPCPGHCYWSRAGGGGHQWDVIELPGTGNFRTSAPGADQCLQERPNPLACRNHAEELLLLTLGAQGVSAHTSTLSLQRAIYLLSSLAVPGSYLRILILICFRIRYILALQHCAAMTTGLHFCCFHTLVFLVLGLFPSSYSLALKT